MDRQTILKKLQEYNRLPGYSLSIKEMTDEQLKKYLEIMEKSFDDYFQD